MTTLPEIREIDFIFVGRVLNYQLPKKYAGHSLLANSEANLLTVELSLTVYIMVVGGLAQLLRGIWRLHVKIKKTSSRIIMEKKTKWNLQQVLAIKNWKLLANSCQE
jgi:hypothetical protein